MRKITYGIGSLALAALVLTGCAGGGTATDTKTDSAGSDTTSQTTEATEATSDDTNADCPELKTGDEIESSVFAKCAQAEAEGIAGYAVNIDSMGITTTAKYNPSAQEVEMELAGGKLIYVGGKGYIQGAGATEWVDPDPSSSDPIIAGLSAAAKTIEEKGGVGAIDTSLLTPATYKVTGEDTRLGQPVSVVEGTMEVGGVPANLTFYVTKDYGVLETLTSSEVNGQKVDSTTTVTEWDKAQDIKAPK